MADGNPPAPNPYVFGYGSLIWNPGFPFIRSERALLRGAHRSLSVYSHRHRGTAERPGLVFGLSRGGSCVGVAFEVEAANWPAVFDYLQEREQDRGVYREVFREVTLTSGKRVRALAYLVDETHPQFAGRLTIARSGRAGPRRHRTIGSQHRICPQHSAAPAVARYSRPDAGGNRRRARWRRGTSDQERVSGWLNEPDWARLAKD